MPAQPLGAVTDPLTPATFPYDGLIGFAGLQQTALNASSWFNHLCDEGVLDECRFGIAYETDSTGTQYFGKVEHHVFEGELSKAPLYLPGWQWDTYADIAANGKVIERDALVITDSGTTVIFGCRYLSYPSYSFADFLDPLTPFKRCLMPQAFSQSSRRTPPQMVFRP